MALKVEKFDYNSEDELLSNTYVISDEKKSALIIDPSKDYLGIVNFLKKNELNPQAILLTHGHFDHFKGVEKLVQNYPNIEVYIHYEDESLLTDAKLNCSYYMASPETYEGKVETFLDEKTFHFLGEEIKVIHTPFHTEGSVCYYFVSNKLLFSGDTLLKNGFGRVDLPTSNQRKIISSLKKLDLLPKDLKLCPGHGPNSVLGVEINQLLHI